MPSGDISKSTPKFKEEKGVGGDRKSLGSLTFKGVVQGLRWYRLSCSHGKYPSPSMQGSQGGTYPWVPPVWALLTQHRRSRQDQRQRRVQPRELQRQGLWSHTLISSCHFYHCSRDKNISALRTRTNVHRRGGGRRGRWVSPPVSSFIQSESQIWGYSGAVQG